MIYSQANSPEDIPKLFKEAWMKRDADMLASLFVEDAEFVNVVGLWWHNREDIRQAHAYGFDKIFGDSELAIRKIKVKNLSEEIAVVHARMRLKGQTKKGDVEVPSIRQNIFSNQRQDSSRIKAFKKGAAEPA